MRRGWLPGAAVLLAALFGGVAAAGPLAEAIRVPAAAERVPLGGDGRLAAVLAGPRDAAAGTEGAAKAALARAEALVAAATAREVALPHFSPLEPILESYF